MRYLVDSDYLIDALGGIASAVTTLDRLSEHGLGVSIVAIGEVYEGAYRFPDPMDVLRTFREYLIDYTVQPLTDPIMEVFARIRADLRRQRRLIPDFDLAIAATAIAHDLTLVTRNRRHFDRVEGLRLYQSR